MSAGGRHTALARGFRTPSWPGAQAGRGRDLELRQVWTALSPAGSPPTFTEVTTWTTAELVPTATLSSTATGPTVTRATAQPTASPVSTAQQPTGWATAHSTEASSPPATSETPTGPTTSKRPAHTFSKRGRGLQARSRSGGQRTPPTRIPDHALSARPQGDSARAPIHHSHPTAGEPEPRRQERPERH